MEGNSDLSYFENLINPSNYIINSNDKGIIFSPNQEEINQLLNLSHPLSNINSQDEIISSIKPLNLVGNQNFFDKLQIKNHIHESYGKLTHDHYLMKECRNF